MIKAAFEYVKERCINNKNGGDSSALTGGEYSVLYGGENAKLKAGKGSVLAFQNWIDGYFKGIKFAEVDGENVKEDTWYTLKDGEIVEWKD